jgi:hypothetical protein
LNELKDGHSIPITAKVTWLQLNIRFDWNLSDDARQIARKFT